MNDALPIVMGHETTATVMDKGKAVNKFEIGERVVVQPAFSCGKCQLCAEGRDNICLAGGMMGRDRQGGFAEYIVVNAENAFRLPDPIGYVEGTQIQTLATVYHSQKRLQLSPGQSVLVIGLGATGLLHVQLAKASGATPVIGLDVSPPKLEMAMKLGADLTIRLPDENVLTRIREATRGKGPDAVIEAVGVASTVALGVDAVAPGGKVLLFGSGHEPLTGFDPFLLYYKEIHMIGTRAAGRADWQPCIDLVESGRIELKPLVTHQMAFQDIKKAFAIMDEGPPELVRVAVLGTDN
jgi:2-desacetyl-2-hydroxyethyl bacteriochlorophyllide A dehydrogenase